MLSLFQVSIREARGLPVTLSHFVFCQYIFWGHNDPVVVPPIMDDADDEIRTDGAVVHFNHQKVSDFQE